MARFSRFLRRRRRRPPAAGVPLLLTLCLLYATAAVEAFLVAPLSGRLARRATSSTSSTCRRTTRLRRSATAATEENAVVLGINKYSHDVSCTVVSAATGDVLFVAEKERVSRKKHDAGDAADLVEWSLAAVGRELSDVALVVQQNHHWRIAPFERRLPWACALEHYPVSYLEDSSLFPGLPAARRLELSHHLAHAWSVFPQAPFEQGLVVVMDGMGEQHKAMARALRDGDPAFAHDLALPKHEAFAQVPATLDPLYDYREAESAYYFDSRKGLQLVFKRYTREHSPPELYNHGFENMESMGAVYSRISSHIFGDWNACGKVMGLTSYARPEEVATLPRFMEGALVTGEFAVNWDALAALEQPNEWREADAATTAHYARLAGRVQADLEETALPWIRELKARTGAENLCVCGGVAQNSVLNGRIARELGFRRVFIPPYPGDEGVSVGCALWGFAALAGRAGGGSAEDKDQQPQEPSPPPPPHPPLRRRYAPLPPYQGRAYSEAEVQAEALEPYGPFIMVERRPSMESVVEATVDALTQGEVVAWFQGRSECGPRALGDRSLLADPRVAAVHPFLNRVKGREAFRPFAPSVLAEAACDWFEGAAGPDGPDGPDGGSDVDSPYMSVTLPVRPERRGEVPAICHVDGSARLQTVREQDNPWYHRLIQAFARRTGVPMVLNTSFNIRGEPIVESPAGAVRSFLSTHGGVGLLVLGQFLVRRRPFPAGDAGGAGSLDPALCVPRRADGILLEEVVRDAGTGVARSVRVAFGSEDGRPLWVDLASELDLFVLSSVDGVTPLEDLVEEIVESLEDDGALEDGEEDPVTPQEVTAAFKRLYDLRLAYFV